MPKRTPSGRTTEFVKFVAEQMNRVRPIQIRAMFGGHGVYQGGRMIAILDHDRLYFKADQATRAEFEAKGLRPFTYHARGKSVNLRYFEAPPEVFEEPEAMDTWMQKAYAAAQRAAKSR